MLSSSGVNPSPSAGGLLTPEISEQRYAFFSGVSGRPCSILITFNRAETLLPEAASAQKYFRLK